MFRFSHREARSESWGRTTESVADPTDCQIILLKRSFGVGAGRREAEAALFLGDSSQDSLSLLSSTHPSFQILFFSPQFLLLLVSLPLPLGIRVRRGMWCPPLLRLPHPMHAAAAIAIVASAAEGGGCQMFRLFSLPTVPNQCPDVATLTHAHLLGVPGLHKVQTSGLIIVLGRPPPLLR